MHLWPHKFPGCFLQRGYEHFMQLCAFYFHLSPPAWYFCIRPLTYLSIEIPYFMGSFDHVNLRAHLSKLFLFGEETTLSVCKPLCMWRFLFSTCLVVIFLNCSNSKSLCDMGHNTFKIQKLI